MAAGCGRHGQKGRHPWTGTLLPPVRRPGGPERWPSSPASSSPARPRRGRATPPIPPRAPSPRRAGRPPPRAAPGGGGAPPPAPAPRAPAPRGGRAALGPAAPLATPAALATSVPSRLAWRSGATQGGFPCLAQLRGRPLDVVTTFVP